MQSSRSSRNEGCTGRSYLPAVAAGIIRRTRRSFARSVCLISSMYGGWRRCRLNGGEGLQNLVGMLCAARHDPGIAGVEQDYLALGMQLRPSTYDVASAVIIPANRRLFRAWRYALPKTHRDVLAGRQVNLPVWSLWRMNAVHFDYSRVTHVGIPCFNQRTLFWKLNCWRNSRQTSQRRRASCRIPSSRNRCVSASLYPSSANTSAPCSLNRGGGVRAPPGVRLSLIGVPSAR